MKAINGHRVMKAPNGKGSATFSDCMSYRYLLVRQWGDEEPLGFCMLNPSTADAFKNDPTVERCEQRARRAGYGGLMVVNIFAFRSTDPQALYEHADPVGQHNNEYILQAAMSAKILICGWGKHGAHLNRGADVLRMLRDNSVVPHALKRNGDGSPAHPLYIGYAQQPVPLLDH